MIVISQDKIDAASNFYYDIVFSNKEKAIEVAFNPQCAALQAFKDLSLLFSDGDAIDGLTDASTISEKWKDASRIVDMSKSIKFVMIPDAEGDVEGKVKDIWGLIGLLDGIIKAFSDTVPDLHDEQQKKTDNKTVHPEFGGNIQNSRLEKPASSSGLYAKFKRLIIPAIIFLSILVGVILLAMLLM